MAEQAAIDQQEYIRVADQKREPVSTDQAISASVNPIVIELKRINELEFDNDIMPLVSKNVASKMVKDQLGLMRSEKLSISPSDISSGLRQYFENEQAREGVDIESVRADIQMAASALLENTLEAERYRDGDRLNEFMKSITGEAVSGAQPGIEEIVPETQIPEVAHEQVAQDREAKKQGLNSLFWRWLKPNEKAQEKPQQ